jgi:hypothetical protein
VSGLDPVTITGKEIYEAVVKLTGAVDRLAGMHDGTARTIRDHEDRLRVLEAARWPLPSLAIVVSLGALAAALFAR